MTTQSIPEDPASWMPGPALDALLSSVDPHQVGNADLPALRAAVPATDSGRILRCPWRQGGPTVPIMVNDNPVPLRGARLSYATSEDVAELVVLQRCCWVTEAILNDTLAIPALHEDGETVRAWVAEQHVWTVRQGPRLVAAVRAHQDGERWEIGRLMVAPDMRGAGLGRWLLEYAESQAPTSVRHFVLFTGARSERNVRMYTKAGYELVEPSDERLDQHINGAVFLTKQRFG